MVKKKKFNIMDFIAAVILIFTFSVCGSGGDSSDGGSEKTVFVGEQSNILMAGISGPATVSFSVTTENIEDGEYDIEVLNLPAGVTLRDEEMEITTGSGELIFDANESIKPGKYKTLVLTITDQATSNRFTLDISTAGAGTDEDPFIVHNLATLQKVGSNSDGYVYYKQKANIDLGSVYNWTPISNFSGSYDGGNYTISNLKISSSDNYQGLFADVSSGGVVKNVKLTNVNISGKQFVGGIVGDNNGGTVLNCSVQGSITGSEYVGGVAGYNSINFSMVEKCYTSGSIAGYKYVGGVVGYNLGTVQNSYATSSVNGSGDFIGGVTGYNLSGGKVLNCYSTGNITGGGSAGGVAGANYGNVSNCVALNSSVKAGSVYRIADDFDSGLLSNNYARNMTLTNNSDPYTPTSCPSGKDGESVVGGQYNNPSFWSETVYFNLTTSGPWKWVGGLPVLRNVP